MIGLKGLAFVPLVLAAGCAAVGPDYERPPIALAPAFVGGNGDAVTELANRAWWQQYRDPMLDDIVRRGLAQNLSAQAAQAAIEQAEANLRATGINDTLSGSASGARQRAGGSQAETGYRTTSSLSADVVIDMFGGVRRTQEAANATLSAARDNAQTQRLAWLAELIAAYSNARYYQQALSLARESVHSREGTVSVTNNKLQAGAATEYDLAEAQALLDTARAEIPNYQAQFNANVFALATLLNEPAAPLMAAMQRGSAPLRTPGTVATGTPADLLRTRPDVRAAEADLHAATAKVGVATADMLPSVTLSGVVSNNGSARTWSFGPAINLPLLNQGALWANRDAQIAAAKAAEVAWRVAVTDAIQGVQVAQSNLTQYRARRAALDTAAASYSRALVLARENYNNGALDLLDLQTTDRSRYAAQISAASAANTAAQEWARLQIATGAGALVQ